MSSEYIQALKIGTGLNTNQLVKAIVDARRAPTENALNEKNIPFEKDKEKIYNGDCHLDTDLEILIPDTYVTNISERLNLYKEINNYKDYCNKKAYCKKFH